MCCDYPTSLIRWWTTVHQVDLLYVCTVMFKIQPGMLPHSLRHASNHICHNGSKYLFHSLVQLTKRMVPNHLFLFNTPYRVVWHGKISVGNVGEPQSFQRLERCSFRVSDTMRTKCASAPSCCSHTVPVTCLSKLWN